MYVFCVRYDYKYDYQWYNVFNTSSTEEIPSYYIVL